MKGDDDDPGQEPGAEETDGIVELSLTDVLDLHGFRPKEIREVVAGYLDEAYEAGFAGVRLIHGKGIGVQREAVRKLLERDPRVASFGDAPIGAGTWGATIVTFRR